MSSVIFESIAFKDVLLLQSSSVHRYQNKPAWWRVDLGQEFDFYEVVLYSIYHFRINPGEAHVSILIGNDNE